MSYKVAENITHRKMENEVVVLNLKNGLYYVLNETASKIWDWLFVDHKSIPKLIAAFSSEYKIDDKDMLKKDLEEQLDFWLKENLIEKA